MNILLSVGKDVVGFIGWENMKLEKGCVCLWCFFIWFFRKGDKFKYVFFFFIGCVWEVGFFVMFYIGEVVGVLCMMVIYGWLWCGLGCNVVIVNIIILEVEVGFCLFLSI